MFKDLNGAELKVGDQVRINGFVTDLKEVGDRKDVQVRCDRIPPGETKTFIFVCSAGHIEKVGVTVPPAPPKAAPVAAPAAKALDREEDLEGVPVAEDADPAAPPVTETEALAADQDPNAPCACGSGTKFKRCHGEAVEPDKTTK